MWEGRRSLGWELKMRIPAVGGRDGSRRPDRHMGRRAQPTIHMRPLDHRLDQLVSGLRDFPLLSTEGCG